jgi:hypothetical protein
VAHLQATLLLLAAGLEEVPQQALLRGLLGVLVVGVRGLLIPQMAAVAVFLPKETPVEMAKTVLNMYLEAAAVRAHEE